LAKVDPRQFEAFVGRPPEACRVVLIYGEDAGLIRDTAERLVRVVSDGDPLRVVEIGKEAARDTVLLRAEASSFSLMGGRRAVRVREAGDAFAAAAREALAGSGPGLVILEAGELPARSKLRALLEPAAAAGVIACWAERAAQVGDAVVGMLRALGVTAEPAAVDALAGQFGADRQVLRRECEKLALYLGPGGRATADDVAAGSEGYAPAEIDAAIGAMFMGELTGGESRLDAALAAGEAPSQLLRAAFWQTQRLLTASAAMAAGADANTAIAALRPPIFFKQRPSFERALRIWSEGALMRLAAELLICERLCRTRGAREATLVRQTLLRATRFAATSR
jgi:DNA polymerase III subunit delta